MRGRGRQYLAMLLPLLICEVTWSLGENVYAAIYGRMGTDASAAMTLTAPVQGLVIGALCGLSQAAGVIVGKRLGSGDEDAAYAAGRRLLVYGAAGAALLSVLVVLLSGVYVEIYQVEDGVKRLTRQILTCLCAGRAMQGPQYDPRRRDPPQRRADGVRHGHRSCSERGASASRRGS